MYVGKRDELDFATYPTRIVMPDYFLINLAAYYDLFSFLRLQGRIENLLDKQYEEIYGLWNGRTFFLWWNKSEMYK